MNDLQHLLAQRSTEPAASILKALREGLAADPAASGPAAALHALLQGFFAIEQVAFGSDHRSAFQRHPEAARQLLALLEDDGETNVARLMRSLIDGQPRPLGALKAGLDEAAGNAARDHGKSIAGALAAFADVALASPASAAEMELSLGWSAVEEGLLDRVAAQSVHLAFAHGESHRQAVSREQQLDALVAQHDVPALLRLLLSERHPRVLARASEWDRQHEQAPAEVVEIPVAHHLRPAPLGPAAQLPADAALAPLRALYACTNGGELFVPLQHQPADPGLQLIADSDWDDERDNVMTWVTMGDDDDTVHPPWVHSLVPFAMLPGDASRWVVPIEGPYVGCVMLSNDDVPDEHVRYPSLPHFLAALCLLPQEVLGNGGYVSYVQGDGRFSLYPVGYRVDAPGLA